MKFFNNGLLVNSTYLAYINANRTRHGTSSDTAPGRVVLFLAMKGMKTASDFNVHRSILVSWLKALTELRNTCAHHFRLWNKVFVNYPKIRNTDKSFPIIEGMESSLGSFLPMVGHLLHVVDERIDWKSEFLHLINTMPLIQPKDMGLHSWPNWEEKK